MNLLYVDGGHMSGRGKKKKYGGHQRRGRRGDRLIYEAGLARVFEGPTSRFCSPAVSPDSGDGLSQRKTLWVFKKKKKKSPLFGAMLDQAVSKGGGASGAMWDL